ncbi:winged helix-turn-helix domain-containing protein [Novosphingobium sp. Leaf2]|uniref:winged helix-turn-helix domain-containing protein n=1 Tax=Novosphingobium sp. Leaf2 TaxID=1735670 RepID=UPI0006F55D9F|nr:response regulator transcription factor [Novosphingobium sp. Leaf2]KQM19455.1 XRE family transcriptional regulator [Novosphingobium sp. Leaf2]
MSQKILMVEDDPATAEFIAKGLEEAGFVVDRAENGRDGLFLSTDGGYACIVLDRMLPGLDGMAVLAALRGAGVETPVIILSALGSPEDRIKGLTGGCDDYMVKPFTFAELLARIKLLIRRSASAPAPDTVLRCDDLEMDLLSRRVRRGDRAIDLQPREFRLLEFLLRHVDQVVTRTMLLEGVWDYHFDPGTNVVDVHLSRLRKKIDEGEARRLLHTVRGAGYRIGSEP